LERSSWFPQPTNGFASFDVPNPAPRTKPRWEGSHLPTTNRLDDLSVVLLGIEPASFSQRTVDGLTILSTESVPKIMLFENDLPARNWTAADFFMTRDEEGRVSASDAHFSPLEPRLFRFELVKTLPPEPSDSLRITNVTFPDNAGGAFP